jgi:aerobic carbon-monoxide dehydrogenase medium subunit
MLPRTFQYFSPKSVEEATEFLSQHPGEAKVLAGGMSLIPLMKLRLASPTYIVDINRLKGLEYIKPSDDGGSLFVGSLTRHHALESSVLVKGRLPLLSEAAGLIGDPQVRNMGTIGGALAHSDPSGDMGATALALRATVKAIGTSGERSIPIDDFLIDTFSTALKEDELVTQVSFPLPKDGSGGAYLKLERKAGDFATVGVAVQLTIEERQGASYFSYAGIGLTALGPKNLRASGAEESLVGKKVTKDSIAEASAAVAEGCSPTDDPLRGSASYKREMAGVYARRAIELAVSRARGRGRVGK